MLASPVTTGMPQLPTPRGSYAVQRKETDVTFYSLWPQGSPFYYSPEHINYAMFFRDIGYYIHDAPWRHAFGPGTQYPHTDPDGTHETGSHGCVNMPTRAAAALYAWVGLARGSSSSGRSGGEWEIRRGLWAPARNPYDNAGRSDPRSADWEIGLSGR